MWFHCGVSQISFYNHHICVGVSLWWAPTFWLVQCGRGQHPSWLSSRIPSLWLCQCRNNTSACWGGWPDDVGREGGDIDSEREINRRETQIDREGEREWDKTAVWQAALDGDLEIAAGSLYIIHVSRRVLWTVCECVCVCVYSACLLPHVCFSSSVKTPTVSVKVFKVSWHR